MAKDFSLFNIFAQKNLIKKSDFIFKEGERFDGAYM